MDGTDLPSSPEEPGERPKLKLKQILTPISPHLTAPRPEADPRLEKKVSIKPAPRAVPIEPEPEPEIPLESHDGAPGEEAGPPLPLAPGDEQAPPGEDPEEQEAEDNESPEEAEGVEPVGADKKWTKRLVVWMAVPVLLVAAIAWLALVILKPPESEPHPGKTVTRQVLQNAANASSKGSANANVSPVELTLALEKQTVESYIEQLKKQEIIPSEKPRGIYINSVFIPEGHPLNPNLGLSLMQVELSPQGALIDLQDQANATYRIALQD